MSLVMPNSKGSREHLPLIAINAKKIILPNEILLEGHVIVNQGTGKIVEVERGYIVDEINCVNCKRRKATYAPADCENCRDIYCKRCAMKMATGGKCKKCGILFASMRRTSEEDSGAAKGRKNTKIIYETDYIIPGFVDIHNHGLGGTDDILDYWTNPGFSLRKLYDSGTTSVFPTITFPDPPKLDRSLKACKVLSRLYQKNNKYGARVEGIHCEGPIIQTQGGLPDSSAQKKWPIAKFNDMLDEIGPCLRIMTVSPSADDKYEMQQTLSKDDQDDVHSFACACNSGEETSKHVSWTISKKIKKKDEHVPQRGQHIFEHIQSLIDRNIVVSLGHDKDCSEDQIFSVLDMPFASETARFHSTHVFNVQRFHHRNIGLANLAYLKKIPPFTIEKYRMNSNAKLPTIELIGDMKHVNPVVIQSVLDTHDNGKSGNICFITDAIAEACPLKALTYADDRKAYVDELGETVVDENGTMCGSCITLYTTFLNLVHKFKLNLVDASRLVSGNPAKIARIYNKTGSVSCGKLGDLICLNDSLEIAHVLVGGRNLDYLGSMPMQKK
eukprot:g9775.t1